MFFVEKNANVWLFIPTEEVFHWKPHLGVSFPFECAK